MLLAAQKDVNRVLDAEVRKLMAQLEDLNQRYVAQVRSSWPSWSSKTSAWQGCRSLR